MLRITFQPQFGVLTLICSWCDLQSEQTAYPLNLVLGISICYFSEHWLVELELLTGRMSWNRIVSVSNNGFSNQCRKNWSWNVSSGVCDHAVYCVGFRTACPEVESSLLSLWSFCLFLHPCFNLHGSHLQEEEVAESGVSGGAFAHVVPAQPIALFSYLHCFLTLCIFCIFFLNPLALAEFQMQTDFKCNLGGFAEVRSTRAVKWWMIILGKCR